MEEILRKAELIKKALKIVDNLANNDLGDIDGDFTVDDFDYEKLQKLIIEARSVKNDYLWKLM